MQNYRHVISELVPIWRLEMIREGLTFDDVLLVPQHSEIGSRSKDVDI